MFYYRDSMNMLGTAKATTLKKNIYNIIELQIKIPSPLEYI
jgi:hypothetical protein